MAFFATAIVFIGFAIFLSALQRRYHSRGIPTARFGWPFVGNATEYVKDPISFLRRASSRYGHVFQVPMLFSNTLWLRGNELNRLYLDTKEDTWSFGDGMGLFLNKVVSPGYFSHLRTLVGSVNRGINRKSALAHYASLADTFASSTIAAWSTQREIGLFEHSSQLAHKVIVACLMGPDFVEKNLEELFQLLHAMEADIGSLWNFVLPAWVPHPAAQRLDAAKKRVWKIFEERLTARLDEPMKWEDSKDYITYTLNDPITAKLKEYYAAHHTLLMFAAHTSTVASIAWTLLELLKSPARLHELRQDLLCYPEAPEDSPYLSACLKESSRHYSGINMLRLARQPAQLGDTLVKPGAVVSISPYLTHHDPVNFARADEWYPERWLEEPELPKTLNNGEQVAFMPFGGGSHRCPGEQMAILIASRVVAKVANEYDMRWGLRGDDRRDVTQLDFSRIGSAWLVGDAFVTIRKRVDIDV